MCASNERNSLIFPTFFQFIYWSKTPISISHKHTGWGAARCKCFWWHTLNYRVRWIGGGCAYVSQFDQWTKSKWFNEFMRLHTARTRIYVAKIGKFWKIRCTSTNGHQVWYSCYFWKQTRKNYRLMKCTAKIYPSQVLTNC